MAKQPETLMVKVAQGNCGLTRWLIQTPSQYRALTPSAPPSVSTATLIQGSTANSPPTLARHAGAITPFLMIRLP